MRSNARPQGPAPRRGTGRRTIPRSALAVAVGATTAAAFALEVAVGGASDAANAWLPAAGVWPLHLSAGLLLAAHATVAARRELRSGRQRRRRGGRARRTCASGPVSERGRATPGNAVTIGDVVLGAAVAGLASVHALAALRLALAPGGGAARLHAWSGFLVVAYPVLHVLAEYAAGQLRHVLQVLSPGPLAFGASAPALADIARDRLACLDGLVGYARGQLAAIPRARQFPAALARHALPVAAATAITALAIVTSRGLGAQEAGADAAAARAPARSAGTAGPRVAAWRAISDPAATRACPLRSDHGVPPGAPSARAR